MKGSAEGHGPKAAGPGFKISELTPRYRKWAVALVEEHWGSEMIVTRGRCHHTRSLPGLVAVSGGRPAGLITYRIDGDQCEVVSLDSLEDGAGIGTALLGAVASRARKQGCRRLWLITTNDNLKAVRFYQKRGFHLVAVHRDALDETRRLKPSLPDTGIDGIPLRDEIELEIRF
jgi:GNAT superfamily N-acetyltransferase